MKTIVSLLPGCTVLALLAVSAGFPAASAADGAVPTVTVAKTEAQHIAYWQPAMGEGLAQMMITELNKLDNMKVLESVALEDLREERRLGESGEVAAGEAVQKGQWKGSDYTFKTVLTRFGAKENNYGGGGGIPVPTPRGLGIGFGGFGVKKTEHEVQIDWRVVDNATREIVKGASGSAVGIEKGGGFNFSSWGGSGFANDKQFMDSALGKATVKAIAQIVATVKTLNLPVSGRVNSQAAQAQAASAQANAAAAQASAASRDQRKVRGSVELVDGKEVWVSLGSQHGFAKGDKVKLYQPVEKKNKQGKVITTTYKEAGEITLSKVQKDKSMGEFQGAGTIEEGWAVADSAFDIDTIEKTSQ